MTWKQNQRRKRLNREISQDFAKIFAFTAFLRQGEHLLLLDIVVKTLWSGRFNFSANNYEKMYLLIDHFILSEWQLSATILADVTHV